LLTKINLLKKEEDQKRIKIKLGIIIFITIIYKMIDYRNIEKETLKNKNYRKVLYTVPGKNQLVLMSLKPGEDIPKEIHQHTSQFFRIEKGKGIAIVGDKTYRLKDGMSLIIPPNKKHYIKNTSKTEDLKIYTIYSPGVHPPNRVDKRQPLNDEH